MNCDTCQNYPYLEDKVCNIMFISDSNVLTEKINSILTGDIKIDFEIFEDLGSFIVSVRVDKCLSFLKSLKEGNFFSQIEAEEISMAVLRDGENLSMFSLKKVKPMRYWFGLIDGQDYLDILKYSRLKAFFQPIVDTKSLSIVGYESLVRGFKEDGSLVSPAYIFTMAEKTSSLNYLDRVCRELAISTASNLGIAEKLIFINFVPTSIYDPKTCLRTTIEFAEKYRIDHKNLVFEVVESHKVEDIHHLKNIINYYKDRGFRVALDDVGSGYSGLNTLVKLRPDIIKIDMEIVRDIHTDNIKQSVFKGLVNISKEAGITILAEGVEKKEEFSYIKDYVDFVQGYLFAKPSETPLSEIKVDL